MTRGLWKIYIIIIKTNCSEVVSLVFEPFRVSMVIIVFTKCCILFEWNLVSVSLYLGNASSYWNKCGLKIYTPNVLNDLLKMSVCNTSPVLESIDLFLF